MTEGAQLRRLVAEWDFVLSTLQAPGRETKPETSRVGVTILAGFLGAGKTTALRHLLQGDHGLKLTAVVNDMGAVNIDAAMVERNTVEQDRAEVITLTNGCSCCAMSGDLARAIDELAASDAPPDGIIIEASGIADPAAMATIVAASTVAQLDGIVTIVDAQAADTWLENPATEPLFQRQLDAGHIIVLNKADLMPERRLEDLTARLGQLAPGRPVITAEHGRLEAWVIMGAALRGARAEPDRRHHQADIFASRAIALPDAIDRQALTTFLENPAPGLLRIKGFVRLRGEGRQVPHVVQAVGRMWNIEPLWDAGPGNDVSEPPWLGLILIGLAAQAEAWEPVEAIARRLR
jgi:G3E family GTPase